MISKSPLSVPQAAHRLGLSASMVRRHCQNGMLPAVKVGSTWVIAAADLEKFASKPRRRGPKIKQAEIDDLQELAMKEIAHAFSVAPKWK